jgi:hypothetical protein
MADLKKLFHKRGISPKINIIMVVNGKIIMFVNKLIRNNHLTFIVIYGRLEAIVPQRRGGNISCHS